AGGRRAVERRRECRRSEPGAARPEHGPGHEGLSRGAREPGCARRGHLPADVVPRGGGDRGARGRQACRLREAAGPDLRPVLKDAAADQRYGKILAARFRRVSGPPAWSKGTYFKGAESGGALLDMHIHDTDFIQFVFGAPRRVFSTGLTRYSGAIDHVVTQYE